MEQKLREAAAKLPETCLPFDSIQTKNKRALWPRVATLAACLLLLMGIGFGAYGCAAEVREYKDAVAFFEENDLPTEGLSRSEIKAVYRDITTQSFSYSKTAEVIKNSLKTEQVPGFAISQETPTPEAVENLWNYANGNFTMQHTTYVYHWDYEEKIRGEFKDEVVSQSRLEKHEGDTVVWTAVTTDFRIDGYREVSDGVVVYGEMDNWYGTRKSYPKLAKIDQNGNVLWTEAIDNGFEDEYIAAVLENDDGTYAVFTRGDFEYLCLSTYSAKGSQQSFHKTSVGNYGIWNAARLGDGYLVQLGSFVTDEHARIVKVDREGHITDDYSYSGDNADYYITDMIEFDGQIYLSAYSVPKREDEGGRDEIAGILSYLFDNNIWEISSEELTPMVRDNYTAILLRCDPSGGQPQEFYAVEGSLGGPLAVSAEGKLLWDVESFVSAEFSPATSAFSIAGNCQVFAYTFDAAGLLVNQEKTERITQYWR